MWMRVEVFFLSADWMPRSDSRKEVESSPSQVLSVAGKLARDFRQHTDQTLIYTKRRKCLRVLQICISRKFFEFGLTIVITFCKCISTL